MYIQRIALPEGTTVDVGIATVVDVKKVGTVDKRSGVEVGERPIKSTQCSIFLQLI